MWVSGNGNEWFWFNLCEHIVIPLFFFSTSPRSNNGNRIVQTRLMHDLLMAIKVAMMLVQKLQENIQGSLWKNHESFVWQSMCNLLKSSSDFLMDGKFNNIQRQMFSFYWSCSFCSKHNLYVEKLVLYSLNGGWTVKINGSGEQ